MGWSPEIRRSAGGIGFAASSAATFGMPLGTGAMIAVNGKRSRVYRLPVSTVAEEGWRDNRSHPPAACAGMMDVMLMRDKINGDDFRDRSVR